MKPVAVLVTVLAAVVTLPVPAGAASPIQPSNQPTPITGAANGRLPASDLVNVAPGCQAARAAGPSIGLLLALARDEGVVLGTEQCYRSLADQEAEQSQWTAAGNSACAAPVQQSSSSGATGTSMHGWGKAADFHDAHGTVAFGSPGYAFLQSNAGRLGWNHPGWAQPGGSACPEAWHWEWVGDGGTAGDSPVKADVVGIIAGDTDGYATITGLGSLATGAGFADVGSTASTAIAWLIVGAASRPTGGGYWLVGSDGGVFSFGDATFHGSTGATHLNARIVGMAATPDGGGYWLVGSDGGVFSFGDATFHGSTGATHLNARIVGMAATPDGGGYWLVAADGGIFTFGDATFHGSTGATHLNAPIVGMAATPDGGGYWLVAADGGIFSFAGATFHGSTGSAPLVEPAVGIAPTPSGQGYWITTAGGVVTAFGDAGT